MGQNELAEQSSEEGESSSSQNSVTNSQTRSSSRRHSTAGSRSSTLATSPHSGTGSRPTSHQLPSEEHTSEEEEPVDRPTRSRSSTLSSRPPHHNSMRRASHRPSAEDPSETLIGGSQSQRASSPPNQSTSPSRGRSTRSRRSSPASSASRPVSLIPGLRGRGSLRADALAALQYTGEIPPRAHQALSPGRSVSSERSVHAPLLPRRSSSRAPRRYLDRF